MRKESFALFQKWQPGMLCLLVIICVYSSGYAADTRPQPPTNYSLYGSGDAPANPLNNDGQSLELGMRFRVTEPGIVRAIRFYKGAGTTGTHIGNLWTNTGTLLRSTTFTSETSSGWQEMALAVPLVLDTGVTYVVSCFSSSGDYGYTGAHFTSTISSGPIRGLADGVDGNNGLFKYTGSSAFPDQSFNSSGYFVDIVFSPGASAHVLTGTANYVARFISSAELSNSLIYDNGTAIGIGTDQLMDTSYRLFVEKGIRTRRVKVDQSAWPDFVFDSSYQLMPMQKLDSFIQKNRHLPGVPPAAEIERSGLDLGANQAVLLQKMEEIVLYLLHQQRELEALRRRIAELENGNFQQP